jgi:CIC family chloride channel protein
MSHFIEPASFYFKELIERGQFLRPGTDERILSDLSIRELIDTDHLKVSENMVFRTFVEMLKSSDQNYFPVIDEQTGNYRGIIHISSIRQYVLDPDMYDMIFLDQIMDTDIRIANLENELTEVLEMMEDNRMDSIPVVENDRFIGMIVKTRILDFYRKELIVQTRMH